ncbi:cytochrome P450 4c21 [Culex quinquefasciatus]|uniref:Cytochrome P450 4c21 n=1 Tax=Culex quinquefasciatus TaxID=7176 RepID=B0WK31_CULQU|nr:cytochrome P450 4c21 [Culex quinquefasciatus]|eukprot:XP_001849065.1 cytochrome P450 4c21 [Culex quinquefasciatus]
MAAVSVFGFLCYLVLVGLIAISVKYLYSIRFAWRIPLAPSAKRYTAHTRYFFGQDTQRALHTMIRFCTTPLRIARLQIGPTPVILLLHPDVIQKVLSSNEMYSKPFIYDLMQIGRGLISERDGAYWKKTRKAVNPSFSPKILAGFVPRFDSRAQALVNRLRPVADGITVINILDYAAQCTLEMVFSTTLGSKLEELPGEREYTEYLERIQNILGKRLLNYENFLDQIYKFTDAYRQEMSYRKITNGFVDNIIEARRQKLRDSNNNNSKDSEDDLDSCFKANIFLDEIFNIRFDGKPLDDKEVSDHMYTMIAAGNETSAQAFCYVCLMLAQNPDVQDKVVTELREVLPPRGEPLTPEVLKNLEYTERVIKETLRLFPVAPLVSRQTTSPIELDGFHIPPGQILAMNFYTLHRRPDVWGPDPERFDPDRFLVDAVRERHPYAYLPFSGGFRICIGHKYAMNALKAMLARVLTEFEIRTDIRQSDMKFRFELSMKLVGPHAVTLSRRSLL